MTPILQTLIPLVRQHAKIQQGSWFQGNPCISGSPDDELDAFLESRSIKLGGIQTADRDLLYDAYLDGVDAFFRQRLASPVSVAPAASGVIAPPSVPDAVKIAVKQLSEVVDHLELVGSGYRTESSVFRDIQKSVTEARSALSALRRLTFEDEWDSPEGLRVPASGLDSSGADVPPFKASHSVNQNRFVWWSWHPTYPQWAQSCWGADSLREAILDLHRPMACKMRQYHNKLIRLDGSTHIEVANLPPNEDLDRWQFEVDRLFLEARKASAHEVAKVRPVDEGAASQEPSSEDKELLTEAQAAIRALLSVIGTVVPPCTNVKDFMSAKEFALRTLHSQGAQASTTPQKGGKGA